MENRGSRLQQLLDSLGTRILVLDGAMGTMIHQATLSIQTDYLGRENCPEILNVTRPEVIEGIHSAYLAAGADIIETNTFGGAPMTLADNKLEDRTYDLNPRRGRTRTESRGSVLHRAQAALRRRLHGPDDQEHHHHRHHDLRPVHSRLL